MRYHLNSKIFGGTEISATVSNAKFKCMQFANTNGPCISAAAIPPCLCLSEWDDLGPTCGLFGVPPRLWSHPLLDKLTEQIGRALGVGKYRDVMGLSCLVEFYYQGLWATVAF